MEHSTKRSASCLKLCTRALKAIGRRLHSPDRERRKSPHSSCDGCHTIRVPEITIGNEVPETRRFGSKMTTSSDKATRSEDFTEASFVSSSSIAAESPRRISNCDGEVYHVTEAFWASDESERKIRVYYNSRTKIQVYDQVESPPATRANTVWRVQHLADGSLRISRVWCTPEATKLVCITAIWNALLAWLGTWIIRNYIYQLPTFLIITISGAAWIFITAAHFSTKTVVTMDRNRIEIKQKPLRCCGGPRDEILPANDIREVHIHRTQEKKKGTTKSPCYTYQIFVVVGKCSRPLLRVETSSDEIKSLRVALFIAQEVEKYLCCLDPPSALS